jgi:hypothetical protein
MSWCSLAPAAAGIAASGCSGVSPWSSAQSSSALLAAAMALSAADISFCIVSWNSIPVAGPAAPLALVLAEVKVGRSLWVDLLLLYGRAGWCRVLLVASDVLLVLEMWYDVDGSGARVAGTGEGSVLLARRPLVSSCLDVSLVPGGKLLGA